MKTDMHFDEEFEVRLDDSLLTDYFYVQDVSGRELANYELDTLAVPGRAGAYLRSKRLQSTPISIKAVMMYDSEEELREAYNELNGLLSSDKPGMMTFSDEPEFSYYVTYAGCDTNDQVRGNQKITLNFFRGDPYKYGLEQTRLFQNDMLQVINDGTADAKPIITVKPLEPITHITLANERGDIMKIGEVPAVDETVTERKTRILTSELATLTGWTAGSSVDNGTIAGQMKVKNDHMWTDDFGTGTGWHGPAVKQSLSESLYDFALEVDLRNIATKREQVGRVEVALLDASNNQVGKVMMQKERQGSWHNRAVIQAGSSAEGWKIINNTGGTETTWHEFDGTMTLRRIGNEWSAYIGKYYNGRHDARDYRTWTDENETFTAPVTQVQVYIAQYADKPVTRLEPYEMLVDRYNANAGGVPYIADANDEVTFDHTINDILINGQSIFHEKFNAEPEKAKSFAATFFPLHQGMNRLYTFPEGKMTTEINYRKRYI
ncbi:distal tail protein Dit [Halobacillus karajensis]|uniref:Siphovirus-type tail component RIFT-related domain-containing protein n=1 Tax=Halobacillus karajensis TaxID=195088 RepID=A0A059NYK8_9BACI|nr:distal tail protein Dit [Halobacillus karajensis]CDQ22567.1 hypothetical protein BN983_00780 [Halobacillus karajensis]CDQ26049.1 hypothetical protein BN981_00260 [Halobacillus karajensis]